MSKLLIKIVDESKGIDFYKLTGATPTLQKFIHENIDNISMSSIEQLKATTDNDEMLSVIDIVTCNQSICNIKYSYIVDAHFVTSII